MLLNTVKIILGRNKVKSHLCILASTNKRSFYELVMYKVMYMQMLWGKGELRKLSGAFPFCKIIELSV